MMGFDWTTEARKRWNEIKERGKGHYKGGDVEVIDLLKAGGMLQDYSLGCIIKYAYRNRRALTTNPVTVKKGDMEKIKHYADMVEYLRLEAEQEMIKIKHYMDRTSDPLGVPGEIHQPTK